MFCTDVGFTPLESRTNLRPPILKGRKDSVWVYSHTQDPKEIEEAARDKIKFCYGVEIDNIVIYDGSQYEAFL